MFLDPQIHFWDDSSPGANFSSKNCFFWAPAAYVRRRDPFFVKEMFFLGACGLRSTLGPITFKAPPCFCLPGYPELPGYSGTARLREFAWSAGSREKPGCPVTSARLLPAF